MMNDEDPTDKVDSWLSWFHTRKSAPIINKSKKTILFQSLKASLPNNECKLQLERKTK